MRDHRALKFLKIAAFIIVGGAAVGFAVMGLWNWLAPVLFRGHRIDFWEALGLFILCKILFGGFHGRHGGRGHWRRRMHERWESMTPEEQQAFRERMNSRCNRFRPAAAQEPRPQQP